MRAKRFSLLIIAAAAVLGGLSTAFADTSVALEDHEWVVSTPCLVLTAVNGSMILFGEPSWVTGIVGSVLGVFTGVLGIAAHEPILIASGSASLLTGAIAIHKSDQADKRLSLGPDLSADAPGLVLSLRF